MIRKLVALLFLCSVLFAIVSCSNGKDSGMTFTGAENEVKLMTLDPGHFHAALVQKSMYDQIDPVVHVYAPDGQDVQDHLTRINGFNTRAENPTAWQTELHISEDFLAKMIAEKPGNVMVTSGNNRNKTKYIKTAVDAGINVLADKPMCINKEGFKLLQEAFESAKKHNVLLYDIMTERYEITTILQKELSLLPQVFGELIIGTAQEPAVTKESVHHFFKYVAGNPIKRPTWYFDTRQQGEGIVDVATHLVDLIQWECFPGKILHPDDVEMIQAKRWPTKVTLAQFEKVTRAHAFPDFLQENIKDGVLSCYSNGEFVYKLKGHFAKVSVIWNYQAPEGAGDTHFSIMRGTKANIIIRQGAEQNYKPELYVEAQADAGGEYGDVLQKAVTDLAKKYPGIGLESSGTVWHITIPDSYRVGHEAHFAQVMEKYLQYLVDGKLPDWETPNMIAKYFTTTSALQMAEK